MNEKLLKGIPEIGFIAGLCLFDFGLRQIYRPLGFIIGGLMLAGCCFFLVYDRIRRGGK